MKKLALICALALLAACGGGGDDTPSTAAACQSSGTSVSLTAQDTKFSVDCLAVDADAAFTINLENKDSDQHNLAIYQNKGGKHLFMGDTKMGPATSTYNVPALGKGTYYFQCDVHPEMNGTFLAV